MDQEGPSTAQESLPPLPSLLVLGLSRTAGTSLDEALRILGYANIYNMNRLATDRAADCPAWLRALRGKYGGGDGKKDGDGRERFGKEDWERLLRGFSVIRGLPGAAFAPELIAAFPSARIILTTRDVDSWYSSCLQTIHWRAHDPVLRLLSWLDVGQASRRYQTLFRAVQDGLYGGDFKTSGRAVFVAHNAHVRRLVRLKQEGEEKRFLEFRPGDGWLPLCAFLGREVPEGPFPQGNGPEAFRREARWRDGWVALRIAGRAVLLLLAVFGMWVVMYVW
ncbi:NAD dependent epimerase [Drepanopeziza brunnea f. sp. 'multigermtubi' MB_m1]|uniref:NAD dependent epimerase n=1 Tax=Marssonina brunnea f. sp. multigermtubi (strain MB_m1) TaxID=1072389 RepID=K1X6A5_MARBU|nr:NAD dependent epimerase [Drepanopeziza brunnea f. sp. 'multigermtubi' MB_m1]EKD16158.1 NAD dependent epimerase [Drepanopeziza brunnea f. sp. 'multigermtubi' MB_m1]